jgi:hypothetical protein
MDIYNLFLYLGIATYLCLLITFLVGLRVLKFGLKAHKIFAIITFIFATSHAGIFVYMNYLA